MSDDVLKIAFRSVWRCVGSPMARQRGELHVVIDPNPPDVISTSDSHIWRGPAEDFVRQFRLEKEADGDAQAA